MVNIMLALSRGVFRIGFFMLALMLAACTSAPPASTPTTAPVAAPTAAKPPATPAAAAAQAAVAQPTAVAPLDEAYAKLYPGAKQEAKLVLYGVGTPDLYEPIRAGFASRFPGIELQGVDQRGRDSREKIVAEQQSKNYVADVVISGTDTQAELVSLGLTEAYQPAEIGNAIPGLVPAGGAMSPLTLTIFTIAINTTLVPPDQEPKSWQDVLDAKWRGKLAMDDPRGSGPAAPSCLESTTS